MKLNQSGTLQKPWACPSQQFGSSLKRKKTTGELNYVKEPSRLRKTTVVDDRRVLSMVKKTPLTTPQQIKNTLLDAGVNVSKSTIRRRLHQQDHRG
jgi:hypothetical protein